MSRIERQGKRIKGEGEALESLMIYHYINNNTLEWAERRLLVGAYQRGFFCKVQMIKAGRDLPIKSYGSIWIFIEIRYIIIYLKCKNNIIYR
nr:MAG TPA: hypothetical protein [Caudoviricetes sp.]